MNPFRFFTRLTLRFVEHITTKSAGELLEGLKTAPETSIYYHTHRFLQRYQFLVPEPANDFSHWASTLLIHRPLGQALELVDPLHFSSVDDLRNALIRAVEPFAEDKIEAAEGKQFQFLSARRWSVATPHTANTFREMAEGIRRVTASSLYLHVFEARLRLPEGENDFSHWLLNERGAKALAQRCRAVGLKKRTMEEIRRELIELFDNAEDGHATA